MKPIQVVTRVEEAFTAKHNCSRYRCVACCSAAFHMPGLPCLQGTYTPSVTAPFLTFLLNLGLALPPHLSGLFCCQMCSWAGRALADALRASPSAVDA
eukprot:1146506-Pelagomonas_calceolata.AAC.3